LDEVLTSIIVTIAHGKDMDGKCWNAHCSLKTTTTWPMPFYFIRW